jgi:putative ABC transport system ATP-binding protein
VAETGAALVLVTHDENLAARADRAVRMRDGRVAPESQGTGSLTAA